MQLKQIFGPVFKLVCLGQDGEVGRCKHRARLVNKMPVRHLGRSFGNMTLIHHMSHIDPIRALRRVRFKLIEFALDERIASRPRLREAQCSRTCPLPELLLRITTYHEYRVRALDSHLEIIRGWLIFILGMVAGIMQPGIIW